MKIDTPSVKGGLATGLAARLAARVAAGLAAAAAAMLALTAMPALAQAPAAPLAAVALGQSAELDPAGQSISVTIGNFPTRAGLYLQQCKEAPAGVRPSAADCNAAAQLWISRIPGASFVPGAPITMKLDPKFGAVDCVKEKCVVFVRYDHTAPGDLSQDQAIAISFAKVDQSLTLPRAGLKLGQSVKLPKQTQQGAVISYAVRDAARCSVKGNVVTGMKASLCRVVAKAPATGEFGELAQTIRLQVKR
jgi:hypothetical protein